VAAIWFVVHPQYLFNTGPNAACLQTNLGDRSAYVEGFLEGAEHLAEGLAKKDLPPDIIVYGALYLYRHGLELGLKALLATYHYIEHNADKSFEGHVLKDLWETLRPQLKPIDRIHEEADFFESEAVEYIGECVKVLHNVDPDGQSIRYGENRKGQLNMKHVVTVNLDVLLDMCRMTRLWLHNTLNHQMMADNHWRHERGYFNVAE
jgi:hypothetical protein